MLCADVFYLKLARPLFDSGDGTFLNFLARVISLIEQLFGVWAVSRLCSLRNTKNHLPILVVWGYKKFIPLLVAFGQRKLDFISITINTCFL